MSECPLCSMKPFFDMAGEWHGYSSSKQLESGPWISLRACKDKYDRLAIYATAEDDTDFYYPNFCPECGKRLREETT